MLFRRWKMYACTVFDSCRCHGALKELLQAAVVAEDVRIQIHTSAGTNALLAALTPAAGTLRTLDATMADDLVCPQPFSQPNNRIRSAGNIYCSWIWQPNWRLTGRPLSSLPDKVHVQEPCCSKEQQVCHINVKPGH